MTPSRCPDDGGSSSSQTKSKSLDSAGSACFGETGCTDATHGVRLGRLANWLDVQPEESVELVAEPVPVECRRRASQSGGRSCGSASRCSTFTNEADEQSRRLQTALGEWALDPQNPSATKSIALSSLLAGQLRHRGLSGLVSLARLLEHSLMRSQALGAGDVAAAELFNEAAEEIRRLLHQFAVASSRPHRMTDERRLEDYDLDASRRRKPAFWLPITNPRRVRSACRSASQRNGALDLDLPEVEAAEPRRRGGRTLLLTQPSAEVPQLAEAEWSRSSG